jgi:hypothetical protein
MLRVLTILTVGLMINVAAALLALAAVSPP